MRGLPFLNLIFSIVNYVSQKIRNNNITSLHFIKPRIGFIYSLLSYFQIHCSVNLTSLNVQSHADSNMINLFVQVQLLCTIILKIYIPNPTAKVHAWKKCAIQTGQSYYITQTPKSVKKKVQKQYVKSSALYFNTILVGFLIKFKEIYSTL